MGESVLRSLYLQPVGSQAALQEGQRALDGEGEEGDENRAGEQPVFAVDVAVDDEVAKRFDTGQGCDRGGGEDRDRGAADPAHDRGNRDRQLDLSDDRDLAHPDATGGVDGGTVDLADADGGGVEDRRGSRGWPERGGGSGGG